MTPEKMKLGIVHNELSLYETDDSHNATLDGFFQDPNFHRKIEKAGF